MEIICLASIAIALWVTFFNGAETIEKTFLGYLEFGALADKAIYIKAVAWLTVALSLIILITK